MFLPFENITFIIKSPCKVLNRKDNSDLLNLTVSFMLLTLNLEVWEKYGGRDPSWD